MGRKCSYEREDVLKKAMKLFWNKGYEGTHLDELVKVTGVNRFSLYKEFNGKDGLFNEVLDCYIEQANERYMALHKKPLGFSNLIEYFISGKFDKKSNGCLLVNSISEKKIINKKANNKIRNFFLNIENLFLENLKSAIKNKEVSSKINAKALTKFLITFDMGLAMYSNISQEKNDRGNIISILNNLIYKEGKNHDKI